MNGRRKAKYPSNAKNKRLKIKISKLKYIFIGSIPFADIINALKHLDKTATGLNSADMISFLTVY